LNARIGFPNEHLAAGHIEELAKPMYATCIGLILKGYNVFENVQYQQHKAEKKVRSTGTVSPEETTAEVFVDEEIATVKVGKRKSLKGFMDSIKDGLIDLFKEEEDRKL
jgi:cell division protein FtsA